MLTTQNLNIFKILGISNFNVSFIQQLEKKVLKSGFFQQHHKTQFTHGGNDAEIKY